MFDELYDATVPVAQGTTMEQIFEEYTIAQMRQFMATPDIRPCWFDGTLDGWLDRIDLWGKVKITWNNPEQWGGKKVLNRDQLIKYLTDKNLTNVFGLWGTERLDVNKVVVFRDYVGLNGKKYTDKFTIEVALKPELKKSL